MKLVDDADGKTEMTILKHPASQVFVIKRKFDKETNAFGKLVLRRFTLDTHHISRNFRLKRGILLHHIDYGRLFDGHGVIPNDISFDTFKKVLPYTE